MLASFILGFFILATTTLLLLRRRRRRRGPPQYAFKTFLLTLPESVERQRRFFEAHDSTIPVEVVHGPNTKTVEGARAYEHLVELKHFKRALEMHYSPSVRRPDITYFNLGAVGAMFGHADVWRRAREAGVTYALVFEDNTVPSPHIYGEVQAVIDELGDDFEMVFFHCIARYVDPKKHGTLEKVRWISSMKCYLVHVPNFQRYIKHFFPMDNHVDNKMEDIIAKGARVFYKDMRHCLQIDRSRGSTIGHSEHDNTDFFSRQYPHVSSEELLDGF